ncbi:hypothetical protein NMY22_g10113 [Coprinellus aureogranulatus]|nr:hypothetical protein NMY22_g10113 [Coprinellus aureogranulatus]
MPALPPNTPAKVLVTGATGYVGQWVLRTLLDRGYTARVAVRSEGKAKGVKDIFAEDAGKLEFAVIEDMTKEGAFDEAVAGVDGIVHVATPLPSAGDAPEDTVRIAQEAAVGILKSALRKGNQVKRVVITSTFATIWTPTDQDKPRTFTEKDHNEATMPKWEAGERDHLTVYFASKILEERAIHEFLEAHKQEVKYDVTLINPPFVYGPTLQRISSPKEMLSTSNFWLQSILEKAAGPSMPGAHENSWVDVRDLGEAHVRALEKPEAGGERIGVAAGQSQVEYYEARQNLRDKLLKQLKDGTKEPPTGDDILQAYRNGEELIPIARLKCNGTTVPSSTPSRKPKWTSWRGSKMKRKHTTSG